MVILNCMPKVLQRLLPYSSSLVPSPFCSASLRTGLVAPRVILHRTDPQVHKSTEPAGATREMRRSVGGGPAHHEPPIIHGKSQAIRSSLWMVWFKQIHGSPTDQLPGLPKPRTASMKAMVLQMVRSQASRQGKPSW